MARAARLAAGGGGKGAGGRACGGADHGAPCTVMGVRAVITASGLRADHRASADDVRAGTAGRGGERGVGGGAHSGRP